MVTKSKKAINGIIWSGIDRFSSMGIQFATSVILARLLSPGDFGLIALTLTFTIIFQTINEYGFNVALMNKLDRDDLDYSSVFILNIFLGFFLYLILFFCSPIISEFFKQPLLSVLIRIIGLNLIINSFVVVQQAIYTIQVDFKTQAKASLVAVIISGTIGIIFAYKGLGVWSLVIQTLINNSISVILLWTLSKWKPKKIQFSFIRIKILFLFAYKLILARLIDVVFQQSYSIIIGKFFNVNQLGYFNRANSLVQLSSGTITNIIQRVSTPLLCEEKNDNKGLSKMLLKFIVNAAFIIYPILFGLSVLATPLIIVLLTEKWLPSVWILQILCPVGVLYVINTFNLNIFNATGRTDWALKVEIIKKIIFITILIVAISINFTALIISQLMIAVIELLINTHYTNKQIGLNIFQQFYALKGVILSSGFMAISVYFFSNLFTDNFYKLLTGFISGLFIYVGLVYFFNVNNSKFLIANYLKSS
jgi:teichuronic acid exporter